MRAISTSSFAHPAVTHILLVFRGRGAVAAMVGR